MQSQTERDHEGLAAKREREAGTAEPSFDPEEITGRYTGEELAEKRAAREPDARVARLETKHDQLAKEVTDVRVSVASIDGKLTVLPELVSTIKGMAHVRFKAEVDIDKAEAKDEIDARRVRRRTIAKIVGGVLGGVSLMEILRRLGVFG